MFSVPDVGFCPLFRDGYGFLNMASLMLCRNAYMIVEHHYPFDRSAVFPALVIPRPVSIRSHNSEEEKE